jgi:DtxR family transcriptional regulator, Mn-dependent transcriptional regulator
MPHPENATEVSPAIQDYLKLCYQVSKLNAGQVSMADLAKALQVRAPSVTNMVKKLEGLRLMRRTTSGSLALTPRGESIALEVIRHHRLLETFLVNTLGMDWAEAHKEAEVLEHYISERLESLIDRHLANPTRDPHGEPIPTPSGVVPKHLPPTLLESPLQQKSTIAQIRSRDPAMLSYLQHHKLTPGTTVSVQDVGPFHGPLAIDIDGTIVHVSREVAQCIYVSH